MDIVFHVGYPKTGTTYLQKEVFPNIENINYHDFFNTPDKDFKRMLMVLTDPAEGFDAGRFRNSFSKFLVEDRLNFFSNEILCGHAFHRDITLPMRVADRIQTIYPDARIIVGVREPSGAILSYYRQFIHNGGVLDFERYVDEKIHVGWYLYDTYVSHLKTLFGEENVHVYDFKQLREDPKVMIDSITGFLGVKTPDYDMTKRNVGYGKRQIEVARMLNRLFRTPLNPKGIVPWKESWWFFPFPPRFLLQNKLSFWLNYDRNIITDEERKKLTLLIDNAKGQT